MYDFGISFSPVAEDNFLKSMINTGATPSRDDTYTIFLSQKQNVTGTLLEQYQVARGCGISQVKVSVKNGDLVVVDSDWIANDIATWVTTSPFTTPTYASPITTVPWSAVDTGATPLSWGGTSYDVRNFSFTVNHNPDRVQVIGQSQTTWIQQTTREITIDMDVVFKDTSLQGDVKTLTPRVLIFTLNSISPTTLTFTDAYLESYDETVDAESTDAKVVSYSGFAASVVMA